MAANTKIEWCDRTWSPLVGCSKVSPGCRICYAVGHVHRMAGNPNPKIRAANEGLTARHANGLLDWTGVVRTLPERLREPLTWKQPHRVFVNSLSDLFHEDVPVDFIAQVWAVMAATQHHVFQILTKRPERMAQVLSDPAFAALVSMRYGQMDLRRTGVPDKLLIRLPLPGVWLGTSVEDQKAADERIPHLLATPAAIHFLSCEPLLAALDLRPYLARISWIICGGESGKGARPMHPDWARSLRDQCQAAGVPYFHKQWGAYAPLLGRSLADVRFPMVGVRRDGRLLQAGDGLTDDTAMMVRVGKKAAGRLLDGVLWDQFPAVSR